jgi:hypothetical protein
MGSRDAEEMSGRSNDYDARELVRASMIRGRALWKRQALPLGLGGLPACLHALRTGRGAG